MKERFGLLDLCEMVFRLFWILFWLFGIIYTGYAVYQDTNHYLDYPSMILRKEESLGEFNIRDQHH